MNRQAAGDGSHLRTARGSAQASCSNCEFAGKILDHIRNMCVCVLRTACVLKMSSLLLCGL